MFEFTDNGLIAQPERLFSVRPRSAVAGTQAGGGGNRGVRTRIRLLTTDADAAKKRALNSFVTGSDAASFVASRLITADPGAGFSEFLLTNVQVTYNEKVQIVPTFGDSEVVYYFGKAPVIFQLGGMLIDDVDNQWFTMFIETYANIIRGSELARNHELLEITLPNMVIVGSVMSLSHQQDASRDTDIPFTMTVHAKEVRPLPVQIPGVSFGADAQLINFSKAANFTSFTTVSQINSFKSSIQQGVQNIPALLGRGSTKTGNDTTASLTSFKSSLFSPVFGILTSITKVVKTITGDISRIISSFTNPVNTILREIQGVAAEAIKIANLITKSVNDIVNIPLRTLNEIRKTIIALRRARGIISRVPETIAQSIRRLAHSGSLSSGAAFLTGGGTKSASSKAALLNSGTPRTALSGSNVRSS
jgi:hypothetical protein